MITLGIRRRHRLRCCKCTRYELVVAGNVVGCAEGRGELGKAGKLGQGTANAAVPNFDVTGECRMRANIFSTCIFISTLRQIVSPRSRIWRERLVELVCADYRFGRGKAGTFSISATPSHPLVFCSASDM